MSDDIDTAPEQPAPAAGDVLHFLGSMAIPTAPTFWAQPIAAKYGTELVLTQPMTEASRDREGRSWLDILDDEAAQVDVWGKVVVRRGPWPEGTLRVEPGSPEWSEQRENALKRAQRDSVTDSERHDALELVRAVYGGRAITSKTLIDYESGTPK